MIAAGRSFSERWDTGELKAVRSDRLDFRWRLDEPATRLAAGDGKLVVENTRGRGQLVVYSTGRDAACTPLFTVVPPQGLGYGANPLTYHGWVWLEEPWQAFAPAPAARGAR